MTKSFLPERFSKVTRRKFTGWRLGRILATRLLASMLFALIFVTSHPTDTHGLKDVLLVTAGLFLVLTSIKGRLWCILYIGGKKDEVLVVDGPYARCRNPLYFYSALGVAGIAAASGMVSVVALIMLLYFLAYDFVIRMEERKLLLIHGESFQRYCDTVPRFWPTGKVFTEAEHHQFSPRLFHRTFWDAVGFLVGWMMVTGVHVLHAAEVLPKWLQFF